MIIVSFFSKKFSKPRRPSRAEAEPRCLKRRLHAAVFRADTTHKNRGIDISSLANAVEVRRKRLTGPVRRY